MDPVLFLSSVMNIIFEMRAFPKYIYILSKPFPLAFGFVFKGINFLLYFCFQPLTQFCVNSFCEMPVEFV